MRLAELKLIQETDRTPLASALSSLGVNYRLNLSDINANDVAPSLQPIIERHILNANPSTGLSDAEIEELRKQTGDDEGKIENLHGQFMNLFRVYNRLDSDFRNGVKDFPATLELAQAATGRKIKEARDWFNYIDLNIDRISATHEAEIRDQMNDMRSLLLAAIMKVSVGESWSQKNIADFKTALVKYSDAADKDPKPLIARVEQYMTVLHVLRRNTQAVLKSIETKLRKK